MRKTNKEKASLDDGFNSEYLKDACFEGIFELPTLDNPQKIVIPDGFTPFSRRKEVASDNEILDFFEMDVKFAEFLRNPDVFVGEFKRFSAVLSPDCSLYRDAPLYVQLLNVARSRILGHRMQSMGINVYPFVRWGNEDTYTKSVLPEAIAFTGVPRASLIVVSTYGCIKSREDKFHFEAGLHECLQTLTPKVVLVHGAMSEKVFGPYLRYAEFHQYPDWITRKKGGR